MSPLARALYGLVVVYQYTLSAFIGRSCRFLPTCSNYALDALSKHGAIQGSLLAGRRILRCHPWGGSGYDPVPEPGEERRPEGTSRHHACGGAHHRH